MATNNSKSKCPPHYWLIDSQGIGVCKLCGAIKDFGRLLRQQTGEDKLKVKRYSGIKKTRRKRVSHDRPAS